MNKIKLYQGYKIISCNKKEQILKIESIQKEISDIIEENFINLTMKL